MAHVETLLVMLFNVDLVSIWKEANKLLADNPLLEKLIFGGLASLPLFFRKFREWLIEKAKVFGRWLRDQVLCAHVFPFLGLVTKKELEQAISSRIPSSRIEPANPFPRIIDRLGIKIGLHDDISNYLGHIDESKLDEDTLDRLIHGPFCPKCLRSLAFWDGSSGTHNWMRRRCENERCDWSWPGSHWPTAGNRIPLFAIKHELYKSLSAEFRRTGKLADID